MNILLLTCRDPGGRRTGRKTVLAGTVAVLRDLGHEVRVLAIAPALDGRRPAALDGVPVVALRPPRLPRVALNAATGFPTGARALNECLYDSRAIRRGVRAHVAEHAIDVVVADTIRTVGLARASGATVVADLDDLLSERYRQLARAGTEGTTILGYYAESLPRPLLRPAAAVARRVLRLEARVLARREVDAARHVAAVSLVGADEAAVLQRRAGVTVDALPMAVPIPPAAADVLAAPGTSMIFVGGLDYQPNREAIEWFADAVLPAARAAVAGLEVHVVGHCPPEVAAALRDRPGLVLRGYVDDLAAELARHRAFVAPIRSGTGVKTKVVEAMAAGLPVIATPPAADGTGATDGEHLLLARDAGAFAAAIARLAGDAQAAARVGAAGRALAAAGFAPGVLVERWAQTLGRAVGATRPSAGRPGS